MKNHYTLVRNIRKKMRLAEQITPDEIIDYYWSFYRLHETKEIDSRNPVAKERHKKKALYYKDIAEKFEEEAYPGLAKIVSKP
ncbi:Uncharacterised protein [uncultured archaeon]|nr:Uncharacterised protein [uncultured archaeon]